MDIKEKTKYLDVMENKNIIKDLNHRILVAKEHRAKYEVLKLQQELDVQLEKNRIYG